MKFINKSGLKFADISTEAFRSYRFPGGETIEIEAPLLLHVSESGGHRLFDAHGKCHYVPPGWIHLLWVAAPGKAHFVK